MTYRLIFEAGARKSWNKLDADTRSQFQKALAHRLETPHVPAARLRGPGGYYKIKLRAKGYRLIYQVLDAEIVVLVVAIGRRDGDEVYEDWARKTRR